MQIPTFALLLLTAAAAAMPLSDPLDARDAASAQITYYGICTKANNECKYKNQNGKDTFVKCPRFANKKRQQSRAVPLDSVNVAEPFEHFPRLFVPIDI
ncbi:hypothetical protein CCM_02093 [Cordyceps militaris CM01]|uniref:Antifungal protein n=1 Tax=Cordyceps militaris (strain CM01) TaxID=983644 RepID=G3JCL2_CORMM|nr:uncharacterized protein CCM_02093 [Cordyceps militaris CM01]EGX93824.1 hypothetical protein CCM_02093 [Cordyceps militaris CM01]